MTEQMAIERAMRCIIGACDETCSGYSTYIKEGCCSGYEEVAEGLQKALEEIQQYRAIGTVEELQALKEKSVAKKPRIIGNAMICPSCPKVYSNDSVTYCINCGQHLDWE